MNVENQWVKENWAKMAHCFLTFWRPPYHFGCQQIIQLFEKVCADAEKCSCWYCLGGCLMKSVRLLCAGGVKLSIRCMVSLKMMNIFYFFKKKCLFCKILFIFAVTNDVKVVENFT